MKSTSPINSKFLFYALATLALYNAMPSSAAATQNEHNSQPVMTKTAANETAYQARYRAGQEKQIYLSSIASMQTRRTVQKTSPDRSFIQGRAGQEKQVYLSSRRNRPGAENQQHLSQGRIFIRSRAGQEKQVYLSSQRM